MDEIQSTETLFLDTPILESTTSAASSRDISGLYNIDIQYYIFRFIDTAVRLLDVRFNMKVDALTNL